MSPETTLREDDTIKNSKQLYWNQFVRYLETLVSEWKSRSKILLGMGEQGQKCHIAKAT